MKGNGIMLANFELRTFADEEILWHGRYKNLKNILHWHFEYEIISVMEGEVSVIIDGINYIAKSGDMFLCSPSQAHCIDSIGESIVEVTIFKGDDFSADINNKSLLSPKISDIKTIKRFLSMIKTELSEKQSFYTQKVSALTTAMMIDLFRQEEITESDRKHNESYKVLIDMINRTYAETTFLDVAEFSGYSATYFSRIFKRISGMTFSAYLNNIKVEHAVGLVKEGKLTMTDIAHRCGFGTIRNFNRVFKEITGFSPKHLPKQYTLNREVKETRFNPTDPDSMLER